MQSQESLAEKEKVEYHTRSVAVYRCKYCKNETSGKCMVKPRKPTVKLNKKRNHCPKYITAPEKISAAMERFVPIPIVMRPDWYWLSKKQREYLYKLLTSVYAAPGDIASYDPNV